MTVFVRWLRGRWTRLREWWGEETRTTKGRVLLGRLVLAVCFIAGGVKFQQYTDAQRERDNRAAAYARWTQADGQWRVHTSTYNSCLKSLERVLAVRAQFESDANRWDGLAETLDDPAAKQFARNWATDLRNGAFLATPTPTKDDCVDPGPPPEKPQED